MKRALSIFILLGILSLLSGCISIPLGDDLLEISFEGINLVEGESGETADQEEEPDLNSDPESDPESDEDQGEGGPTAGEEAAEEEEDEEEEQAAEKAGGSGEASSCPEVNEGDYEEITDLIGADFYFPACTMVSRIDENRHNLRFALETSEGDFETIYNEYLDFFGDNVHSKTRDRQGESARIELYLNDPKKEQGRTVIIIRNYYDGSNLIEVTYHFPE